MIDATIIKNGTIKLILTGSDNIDTECLKMLNGATCKLITDNLKVGDKSISNGLILEMVAEDKPARSKPIEQKD